MPCHKEHSHALVSFLFHCGNNKIHRSPYAHFHDLAGTKVSIITANVQNMGNSTNSCQTNKSILPTAEVSHRYNISLSNLVPIAATILKH